MLKIEHLTKKVRRKNGSGGFVVTYSQRGDLWIYRA